jgi:hypothetical protein
LGVSVYEIDSAGERYGVHGVDFSILIIDEEYGMLGVMASLGFVEKRVLFGRS